MTAAMRRRILVSHPDRGGSHAAAVNAIAAYKRASGAVPSLPVIDRCVLAYLSDYPAAKCAAIVTALELPRTFVWAALMRMERKDQIHSLRLKRLPSATYKNPYFIAWFAGPQLKALSA